MIYLNNFKEKYYSETSNSSNDFIDKLTVFSNVDLSFKILDALLSDKASLFNILCLIDSIPLAEKEDMTKKATRSLCSTIRNHNSLKSFDYKSPELVKQIYESKILSSITGMQAGKGMPKDDDLEKFKSLLDCEGSNYVKTFMKNLQKRLQKRQSPNKSTRNTR